MSSSPPSHSISCQAECLGRVRDRQITAPLREITCCTRVTPTVVPRIFSLGLTPPPFSGTNAIILRLPTPPPPAVCEASAPAPPDAGAGSPTLSGDDAAVIACQWQRGLGSTLHPHAVHGNVDDDG